ncbi:hypothetical protein ANT_04280 [Anaerolinea thermophila UNI-1]|uniref:Uncharacterized protein n=1 Tax=Anaerolinea thermophila (strain DSM 14523 / JCM 11388 / NBRC 100420 / UNI-1) TaxID=926569 RepID=E8N0R7_ANATU|nr:hypothetical protein ANT_04280 [Anaerolinea thermophila UNI-1]
MIDQNNNQLKTFSKVTFFTFWLDNHHNHNQFSPELSSRNSLQTVNNLAGGMGKITGKETLYHP